MSAAVETLFDVPAFTTKDVSDIASFLLDKMNRVGFEALPVDEQVELRLLRTLLDGFADG